MPDSTIPIIQDVAAAAWQALPAHDRQKVLDRFALLTTLSADRWPRDISRLHTPAPVYVLRVSADLLVLFRQESSGRIVVLDLLPGQPAAQA